MAHASMYVGRCMLASSLKANKSTHTYIFEASRHNWIHVLWPNCTRQSLCRVRHSAKNTRQKIDRHSPLCLVSFIRHSAKKSDRHGAGPVDGGFAECQPCRHSAKIFYFLFLNFFAECQPCRHSAKIFYFFLQNFFAECQPCRHSEKIFYFF